MSYSVSYDSPKKRQPKGWLIFLVVLLCLSVVGGVGVILYFTLHHDDENSECSTVLNDNAFIVGTFYSSADIDTGYYFKNRLYVNIYEDGFPLYRLSFSSDDFISGETLGLDGSFSQVPGRYVYGDIGFVDLSDVIYDLTNGLGLDYWTYLNIQGNYIELYTEWTAGPIMSNPQIVYESGCYLINIPEYDYADVDLQHCWVYTQTCLGGGD